MDFRPCAVPALSLFATYAFWDGAPDELRWQHAFQLASVAALVQLAIVLPQRRPASRLVLAANLYLLLGGLAFFAHQWWFLALYDALRESAVFIIMLAVCQRFLLYRLGRQQGAMIAGLAGPLPDNLKR